MPALPALLRRELGSYFATPLAYLFIVIFLMLSSFFTFKLGNFFDRGQADLTSFFLFHPWLYLILAPPLAMRLWAEERKSGTIELLMTLPVTLLEMVLGKFLAAWLFTGIALLLTFPIWLTVNYLGDPDNGVVVAAYLGSWLMAGAFLAVGSCLSATTGNQVIAFILTVSVCFVFVIIGYPALLEVLYGWAPNWLVDTLASLSFLTHFQSIGRGVLDWRDLLFFVLFIGCWLLATAIVIQVKKAG
ncbi:ABC transporter permease subunit [Exilibacterium tricleocarpae]|uniref:ABC transporter permease subunit n=1 Tax=Exilibacterium tricleocarpae TaxID=2591008 RepID=A0A545U8F9_9GAMM|nr:ABC transporter permease subunit [Exilibacterium tricleocarpae]